MNFLNSFHNAVDNLLDFIDPIIPNTMSPDYAAFIIQRAYRNHLIRKYFKHMKHCGPTQQISHKQEEQKEKRGWFL